jgi:DNA invertase Pin-like site-specific DNA recombinase
MILTVFAGIAEFERALITERTKTGRIAAKQKGVRFGRPPKLSAEQIALGKRLLVEKIKVAVFLLNGGHFYFGHQGTLSLWYDIERSK